MLIIRGVNVFPSQIEELICRMAQLAPHYLLLVDKEGHLDSLTVRVELNPQAPAGTGAGAKDSAAHELEHHIKSLIGVSARVEVADAFAIERVTVGKARRVIDRRPKD
jgi:phenylacetate-CoA ligase